MTSIISRTMAGGEITPELQSRKDVAKVQNGVALARNTIVNRFGSGSNRAGFEFIAEVSNSAQSHREIPFILNSQISYVIVLGNATMRIYSGSTLKATVTTPWLSADLFDLQFVQSGNIITVTSNDYPPYQIERVSDTSWTATEMSFGPAISPPSTVAGTSGGGTGNNYVYAVTAVDADGSESYIGTQAGVELAGIAPTNPVAFRTAANHGLSTGDQILIRDNTFFTELNNRVFTVTVDSVTSATLDGIDGTALNSDVLIGIIISVTQASTAVVTMTSPTFVNGDVIYIADCGMVELNNRTFTVANMATVFDQVQFELSGENSTTHTAGSGGFATQSEADAATGAKTYQLTEELTNVGAVSSNDITLTWVAPTTGTAIDYNVYRQDANGTWGWIGITTELTFIDTGLTPDTAIRPPRDSGAFFLSTDWPATCNHYQQRLCLANPTSDSELFKASRTAATKDFSTRTPAQDDDALSFRLRGRQVSSIRHILELGQLILLTEGGEWIVQGDSAGRLTQAEPNLKQAGYRGSAKIRPITVGSNALYIENVGHAIRDLRFDFGQDTYVGTDLSSFASHLFDGLTVVDWAYQQIPNSIVWMCLSDGSLIGLTYVPEQEIWAFHRHDSAGGLCESVCCIPEGNSYSLYAIWNRTIDGGTKRYIERLNNRVITNIAIDAIFLDSYLTYDGRNTGSTTMKITSAGAYTYGIAMTLTASTAYFTAAMVGNKIILRSKTSAWNDSLGKYVTTTESVIAKITSQASTTATAIPETNVPSSLQNTAVTNWGRMVNGVSGLGHLEGEVVYALADGAVIKGVDQSGVAKSNMTVTSAIITLDDTQTRYAEVIHVGKFYQADIETLDVETLQGETLADKKKIIRSVSLEVTETKGLTASRTRSDEFKELDLGKLTVDDKGLKGGITKTKIPGKWSTGGRIYLRQSDPLPFTINAIIIDGEVGES